MAGGTPHNSRSSDRKTADAAIKASAGKVHGATLEAAIVISRPVCGLPLFARNKVPFILN